MHRACADWVRYDRAKQIFLALAYVEREDPSSGIFASTHGNINANPEYFLLNIYILHAICINLLRQFVSILNENENINFIKFRVAKEIFINLKKQINIYINFKKSIVRV